MPNNDRRGGGAIDLPTAAGEDFNAWLHFEEAFVVSAKIARAKAARPVVSSYRLNITLFEPWMRNERIGGELFGSS